MYIFNKSLAKGCQMQRSIETFLFEWLTSNTRKPLVIRGARQVGKTWTVRNFAVHASKQLIEINIEKQPEFVSYFNSNDPKKVLLNLSAALNKPISPKESLLFIDEIQAAPELLSKLRWFAEDLPELPVIAAGSLLEFALANHTFSMPVGRINYAYLEPLSFEEYLLALDKKNLLGYLFKYEWSTDIPSALHQQLIELFKEYLIIGGMPAAVSSWVNDHALTKITQIHHDLLATYRDDFAKYAGKIDITKLDEVMLTVPRMLGEKFIYSRINPNITSATGKQAIHLLNKAKICHSVISSAANGIPLGSEINEKFFKEIFLDVGLCCTATGLSLNQLNGLNDITLINKGGIAEQVAGQLLRTINPPYIEPSLFYWQREEKNSNAEIDYVIQHENSVMPIEVKAGSTGTLKSLHFFMNAKQFSKAVRINSALPSKNQVTVKNHLGELIQYQLLSIPFYLVGQLHRLLKEF